MKGREGVRMLEGSGRGGWGGKGKRGSWGAPWGLLQVDWWGDAVEPRSWLKEIEKRIGSRAELGGG